MFEKRKELYLHQKLDWMHHEYITILNIKYAVNVQINEVFNQLVFAHGPGRGEYKKAREQVELSFNDLFNTISKQAGAVSSDEEVDLEKSEDVRTIGLKVKYLEIDKKLETIKSDMLSQAEENKPIIQDLNEVDVLFHEFVVLVERWLQHEKEEIVEVEETFNLLTHRNSIILTIGTIITIILSMTMSLSVFRIISIRMNDLVQGTERVAKGKLDVPIQLQGKDELTYLSHEFNSMMMKLQSSQKKLLEQSYYSGVTEMVSGILHNIKNAFSPFMVDTELLRRQIRSMELGHLEAAAKELSAGEIDPEREKDLKKLLCLMSENYREVSEKISTKLEEMRERVLLIEKVMEDQSRFAMPERFRETVTLHELVYDSLTLVKKDFLDRVAVVIDKSLANVGEITTQRIILMQVISNVIINAIESVLRAQVKYGVVNVKAEVKNEDDREIIHVMVTDNGVGIDANDLQDIFQRGTSSKEKRSGLGLHWCANSISALQGKIYAESRGLGKGACFHLLLVRDEEVEELG